MNAGTTEYWNGRGNLPQLVKELERQKETKVDFVVDTRSLKVVCPPDGGMILAARNGSETEAQVREWIGDGVEVKDQALCQIGYKSSPTIPTKFLRELLETKPAATQHLVNQMFDDGNRRFVRCLDGKARAFLSDSYRVLDHYDAAFTALEVGKECDAQVIEASLSDSHMRLKFTTQQIWDRLAAGREGNRPDGNQNHPGNLGNPTRGRNLGWWDNPNYVNEMPGGPDTVHPLVTIENSETGQGGLNIRLGLLQGICFNGLIMTRELAAVHSGSKMDVGMFSEETRNLDVKATVAKMKDIIRAAFTADRFKALIEKVKASQEVEIKSPSPAIDQIIERTDLQEGDRDGILEYFLKDYQATAYGLSQAVSRFAQDVDDSDRSVDIETTAGEIAMNPKMAVVAAG